MTRDENLQSMYHLRLTVPFPMSKVPVEGTGLPDIWFGCGVLFWEKKGRQTENVSESFQKRFKVTLPGTALCDGHCRNFDNKIFRDTTWVSHNGEIDVGMSHC